MRITISIPEEAEERLREIAIAQHRPIRHQIERTLYLAAMGPSEPEDREPVAAEAASGE